MIYILAIPALDQCHKRPDHSCELELRKWKKIKLQREIVRSSWNTRTSQERRAKWWKNTGTVRYLELEHILKAWQQGYLTAVYTSTDISNSTQAEGQLYTLFVSSPSAWVPTCSCFFFLETKRLPLGKATDCRPTWRLAPSFGGWHCQSGPRHRTHLEKEATRCVAQMGCHWAGTLL